MTTKFKEKSEEFGAQEISLKTAIMVFQKKSFPDKK